MYLQSAEFSESKKGELMFCQREEQVIIARKFSKFARVLRFDFESFSEDLGLTDVKYKSIHGLYCPPDSPSFIIHVEVEPEADADKTKLYFKTIMYRWGQFKNPNNRIMRIS
jgi:hypothetical protein